MKIEGKLIYLRPPRRTDMENIVKHINFKEVALPVRVPYPYALKDAEWFINDTQEKRKKKVAFDMAIIDNETKGLIGMIGLNRINWKINKAEVGYWLSKDYWGTGVAKEALMLTLELGFKKYKFNRIFARVDDINPKSFKLLDKCGFIYEGTLRSDDLFKGKPVDTRYYGILSKEFKK
jgi:RimJ/RimL family protein N-acetyltransferase